jgi:hypothetical protein
VDAFELGNESQSVGKLFDPSGDYSCRVRKTPLRRVSPGSLLRSVPVNAWAPRCLRIAPATIRSRRQLYGCFNLLNPSGNFTYHQV